MNTTLRGTLIADSCIELENNTKATIGTVFSFKSYFGDQDNTLYFEGLTDKRFLRFKSEGPLGADIKDMYRVDDWPQCQRFYLHTLSLSNAWFATPKAF